MTACYQLLVGALGAPEAGFESLRSRLSQTRWPVLPSSEAGVRGLAPSIVEQYAAEWDQWLQQESRDGLGEHVDLRIGGARVHAVRFRGSGRVPMLLLHGWPTSFLAFHRVIEPLQALASEIVLASLPGFGTSTLPPGSWSITDSARLLAEAMWAMGHDRFLVHGQDWGSVVARAIAAVEPGRVIGVHVSAGLRGFMAESADDQPAWSRLRGFAVDGGGYLQLQSRRPDSLAFALSDSPVGLLAWQLDKYQLWQAALGTDFGLGTDFIVANATLYWLTASAGTSMRIYSMDAPDLDAAAGGVPTAVSAFGHGDYAARSVSSRENNLVAWCPHDSGGHVASLDSPAELVDDLTDFIDRIGADT
ncbi:alpha/beta fold hydrolase [Micrococcus sp. 2A]|uniref:alpha/beta fold hydrolase n=1 Tax=Micrococcus sp. 2A TaxID=3142261 RepID=UPI0031B9DF27